MPRALACALIYIWYYVLWFGSGELLIPRSERELQTLRRERHAHRWPSMMRGVMLSRPTRRATYHWTLESGELRRSTRSGMLIGDPLGEGENASSTKNELWLQRERLAHRWPSRWGEIWGAENSFLRMRVYSDAQEWGPRHKPGLTSSNKGTKLRA